ncbi:hypothetical protein BKA57DRAFT_118343 [Linnemannia elongata]|nr:hypothetical protein BKA57DRAFT_118343 [Linnemannia elongata]
MHAMHLQMHSTYVRKMLINRTKQVILGIFVFYCTVWYGVCLKGLTGREGGGGGGMYVSNAILGVVVDVYGCDRVLIKLLCLGVWCKIVGRKGRT